MVLCAAQLSSYTQVSMNDTRTELDSHADTTDVGSSTALVLHDYKQPVCVHGYTPDVALMTIVTLSLQWSPMTTQRQGHTHAHFQSGNSHQPPPNNSCITHAAIIHWNPC